MGLLSWYHGHYGDPVSFAVLKCLRALPPVVQHDNRGKKSITGPEELPVRSGRPDATTVFFSFSFNPTSSNAKFIHQHIIRPIPGLSPLQDSDLSTLITVRYFSHSSNHRKNSLCQRMPFWGCSTQWFSSGKKSRRLGMPCSCAALKACSPSA